MKLFVQSMLFIIALVSCTSATQTGNPGNTSDKVIQSVISETDPPIRGIDYNPKVRINVEKALSILIPGKFKSIESKHKQLKYPMHVYSHMCRGEKPCLSSLYIISIIPENTLSYEEVVTGSISRDFAPGSVNPMDEWIQSDTSGASKVKIVYGGEPMAGTVIEGFYYAPEKKVTVKVQSVSLYTEFLSEVDWRRVLIHNYIVYSSIKIL